MTAVWINLVFSFHFYCNLDFYSESRRNRGLKQQIFLNRLYLEEHLGYSFSLASVEVENKASLAKDQHEVDGPLAATKNTASHYTCAANTLGSDTMEDYMAQLTLFGISEM